MYYIHIYKNWQVSTKSCMQCSFVTQRILSSKKKMLTQLLPIFFFTFNIFEICTPSPHLRSFMSAMALTFNCRPSRLSGTAILILVQVALNQHDPHKPMVLVMFYQEKYVMELSVCRYKVRTIVRFWDVLAAISLLI